MRTTGSKLPMSLVLMVPMFKELLNLSLVSIMIREEEMDRMISEPEEEEEEEVEEEEDIEEVSTEDQEINNKQTIKGSTDLETRSAMIESLPLL